MWISEVRAIKQCSVLIHYYLPNHLGKKYLRVDVPVPVGTITFWELQCIPYTPILLQQIQSLYITILGYHTIVVHIIIQKHGCWRIIYTHHAGIRLQHDFLWPMTCGKTEAQRGWGLNKDPYSQSYGFPSSQVQLWELNHKEGWVRKNWCFWTIVLEKSLESPLNCNKIKPVNPKGNQSWIFTGRTDAETPILWPPDAKSWLTGKDPDAGKDWRQEEKGTTEDEMIG